MSISRHCLTVLFLCFVAILVVAQLFHGLGTQSSYKPLFKSNSVNDKEKPARETKKYKEITYTRLGWFQKDAEQGLQFGRTLAGKDLMEAVLANPRYNARYVREICLFFFLSGCHVSYAHISKFPRSLFLQAHGMISS